MKETTAQNIIGLRNINEEMARTACGYVNIYMARYFNLCLAFDLQLMLNNIKIVLLFIYMAVSGLLLEHSKFKITFVNKALCNRNLSLIYFDRIVKRNCNVDMF